MTIDLKTMFLGSIVTVEASSPRGTAWLRDNLAAAEAPVHYCDHRPGVAILQGALDDGLTLQDAGTGRIINTGGAA